MKKLILPVLLGMSVAAAPLAAQHGNGHGNGKKQENASGSAQAHGNGHAQEGTARGNGNGQAQPHVQRNAPSQGQGRGSENRSARTSTRANSGSSSANRTVRRTSGNTSTIRWADRRTRYDDFGRISTRGKNGEGPAFCRSGAGHPQFGRQWCLDKGFGLGSGYWSRAPWSDVRFGTARRSTGSLARDVLIDVLGNVALGRLAYGATGPVTGQWVSYGTTSPTVLQLRSGGLPLAELTDYNRDGRVDLVLVNLGQ